MSDTCENCGHGDWTHKVGRLPWGECEAIASDGFTCACRTYRAPAPVPRESKG